MAALTITATTTLHSEASTATGSHSGWEARAQIGIAEMERNKLLEQDRRRTAELLVAR